MATAAWLEARRGYLGGTDLAAIVGMNRYKSPLQVYLSKKGETEESSGPLAEIGTVLEPYVRDRFAAESGLDVAPSPTVFHRDYAFIGGNPDGLIDSDEVLEIKTYGYGTADEWGEEGTDQIPRHYHVQGTIYTGLTGRRACRFAALHRDKGELKIYRVPFDKELFQLVVAEGVRFWQEHVLTGVAPSPTGHSADLEYLRDKYPTDTGGMVIANSTIEAAAEQMAELKPRIDRLQRTFDDNKALIQEFMGDASLCETMLGSFTWRKAKDSQVIDWKAVALELRDHLFEETDQLTAGEIYSSACDKHTATKPGSRRFLTPIKGEK